MFLCSSCPKTFVEKRDLKLHQRYHKKENYKCLACDKSFSSKQQFNVHSSSGYTVQTSICMLFKFGQK